MPDDKATEEATRIAEIEARAEAATKGPWHAHPPIDEKITGHVFASGKGYIFGGMFDEDGDFIAHARADIPWLLTQLSAALVREQTARTEMVTAEQEAYKRGWIAGSTLTAASIPEKPSPNHRWEDTYPLTMELVNATDKYHRTHNEPLPEIRMNISTLERLCIEWGKRDIEGRWRKPGARFLDTLIIRDDTIPDGTFNLPHPQQQPTALAEGRTHD